MFKKINQKNLDLFKVRQVIIEISGNAVPANCLVPAIAANFHHHVSLYKKVSEKCKAAAINVKSSSKLRKIKEKIVYKKDTEKQRKLLSESHSVKLV